MTNISKVSNQAGTPPPIILQLVDTNSQKNIYLADSVKSYTPDSFKKKDDEQPIEVDPNDSFARSSKEKPKAFADQKLGAKFDPKKAKKVTEETFKWAKRIWGAAEAYDTIDGYVDRFNKNNADA